MDHLQQVGWGRVGREGRRRREEDTAFD